MADQESFDFVIIGAGSSGSLLANRLTAENRFTVLVLEAGGSEYHPFISAPAGFLKTIDHPAFNWCFRTEPSKATKNREILFPLGRIRRPVL